jgi:quinohemoprotein ethanol dehydrogenase
MWEFDTGLGISAPPITYTINGRQYISLLVGFGGAFAGLSREAPELGWSYGAQTRRLISFSLEGATEMAALPPPYFPEPLNGPEFMINEEMASRGAIVYGSCSSCHGPGVIAGGMAPDLRASALALNNEAFASVVREGNLAGRGMPGQPEITDRQLEDLQHFIRQRARETLNLEVIPNSKNTQAETGLH